ncbi:hypothetical protein CC80DRAFT_129479 [Byssothecium circinans]|uniref:Uncharacterized protein n=1 Tax=Byssothecium circinans TaxID=147558 RepID=A0A6A5TR21_9PLEO|nr:hypothetical protein CC80DRAFT_129479 [Byssothecium circinans]
MKSLPGCKRVDRVCGGAGTAKKKAISGMSICCILLGTLAVRTSVRPGGFKNARRTRNLR